MEKTHVGGIPLPLIRCMYCDRAVHMICRNAADMTACAYGDPACDEALHKMLARWTLSSAGRHHLNSLEKEQ
ncbi:MAG: hypothetical protein ACRD9W_04565 [Terriglobia bacterium]